MSLEPTFRCNNSCLHCFCGKQAGDTEEIGREMGTGEVRDILDQAAELGCLWLLITGGEPLLRADFREIYLYAKRKGLLVTLFTNGTLVDDETVDFLAEWRPFFVEVTLYGMSEETYEKVTGVKGSYRKCIEGIGRLVERRVPLSLKTVAMTLNAHEVPGMKAYAESLGLDFRFDPMICARLSYRSSPDLKPLPLRLLPEEVVMLDMADPERMKQWHELFGKFGATVDSDRLYTCGAGLYSLHIDPYGNLCMCMTARNPRYSVPAGSLKEGWGRFIKGLRDVKANESRCVTCRIGSLCEQCPGWAQLEYAEFETPVEYLCEVAHKRAEAMGISTEPSWAVGHNLE
jgi:radical SAM protein with 4Fe4S-binding SPASM domain